MNKFKSGDIDVLVATDVAGRGIHVDGISHVVNYELPEDSEDYVHRIGRTGRAGAEGISISFVSEADAFALPELETYLGQKISCVLPPVPETANTRQDSSAVSDVTPEDAPEQPAAAPESAAPDHQEPTAAEEEKATPAEQTASSEDAQTNEQAERSEPSEPSEPENTDTAAQPAGAEATEATTEANEATSNNSEARETEERPEGNSEPDVVAQKGASTDNSDDNGPLPPEDQDRKLEE